MVVAIGVYGRRGQDRPKEATYVFDAGAPVKGVSKLTESCGEGPESVCYTGPW